MQTATTTPRVQDPHWRNICPDTGSLIVPIMWESGLPNPAYPRQYKLTDGRLMTTAEICRAPDNIHNVSPPTIRRRLHVLEIRDPELLWAPVLEVGRRCNKTEDKP